MSQSADQDAGNTLSKKIPGQDIFIGLWIIGITMVYVFYGLSYLTAIQKVNNLIMSVINLVIPYLR